MLDMNRAGRVFAAMKEANIDTFLVSDPASIRYLTGKMIHPGERMLVLLFDARTQKVEWILSKLFPQETEDPNLPITYFDDTDDKAALLREKLGCSPMTVGIDKRWPAEFLLALMNLLPENTYVNASPLLDGIRQIKDEDEQTKMLEASRLNDLAMDKLIPLAAKGYTEKELGDELLKIYLSLGAEGHSFTPICCYGKNCADPHHENDETRGKTGDAVILDVGCLKDGYCADMTRTVFIGEANEEQQKVYNIVLEANRRAEAMIRPGVRFCDIDAAARDYITEMGYGPQFVHRTGHNIGTEVHEYGDVSSTNTNIVKEGMTFSVEPGIYLPGKFGVRIEDLVLVTADGCIVMNQYDKNLRTVPAEKE